MRPSWKGRGMSQLENPYAPPEADDEQAPESGNDIVPASQGARFVNFLVDSVASRILQGGFIAAAQDSALAVVGSMGVMLGYYVFFELAFQATLGKLLTGTRVVTVNGGKPGLWQILGRTLSRFVPFEPFSFFSSMPVGWHDRWSGTRVVRREALRER
jgi:uncharacterized RDD family membrane protein YckC